MVTAATEVTQALDADALAHLEAGAQALNPQQLWWASGYLAGRAAAAVDGVSIATPAHAVPAAAAVQQPSLTVLYASETGNSRRIAEALAEQARNGGSAVQIEDLALYKPRQLRREQRVALVTATHGLGDPPDGSEAFFDYWFSDAAPRLEPLEFSVLALGDSSYDDYCKVGRDIDARLEALGARRIGPRVDCDVDFENSARAWSETLVSQLQATLPEAAPAQAVPRIRAVPQAYTRTHPFNSEVLTQQKITGRASSKDVRHFELSLEQSGLRYEPGDSLGVVPANPPQLVQELLTETGYGADTPVRVGDTELPLRRALTEKLEITVASRAFVNAYVAVSDADAIPTDADGRAWLAQRQIIDIVAGSKPPADAQQFVDCLRGLTPRLYSIASSADANADEVHLTVRMIDYHAFGRRHLGAASSYLASESSVPVFVERNDRFRLPADPDTPIVMIGAGTGIAPFRAFVEHRALHGARGNNWLVFGDRNQHSDFLYQIEWLRYRKQKVLTRLDLAFSRDQAEKVYVQHRIAEHSRVLFDWLESGAHLYVCGDAESMAPAVHAALLSAVRDAGSLSTDQAEEYLRGLRRDGRYQRDVY